MTQQTITDRHRILQKIDKCHAYIKHHYEQLKYYRRQNIPEARDEIIMEMHYWQVKACELSKQLINTH